MARTSSSSARTSSGDGLDRLVADVVQEAVEAVAAVVAGRLVEPLEVFLRCLRPGRLQRFAARERIRAVLPGSAPWSEGPASWRRRRGAPGSTISLQELGVQVAIDRSWRGQGSVHRAVWRRVPPLADACPYGSNTSWYSAQLDRSSANRYGLTQSTRSRAFESLGFAGPVGRREHGPGPIRTCDEGDRIGFPRSALSVPGSGSWNSEGGAGGEREKRSSLPDRPGDAHGPRDPFCRRTFQSSRRMACSFDAGMSPERFCSLD